MIKLFSCLLLVLPLLSLAQSRTGGGGIIENVTPTKEEKEQKAKNIALDQQLVQLTKIFETQDMECHSDGNHYLEIKGSDFMQLYLKLSILKSTFIADKKCKDISAYTRCLYSPKLQKELEVVTKNNEMKKHIQSKYKLEKKEVHEMIEFFKNFNKKCESHGCKM